STARRAGSRWLSALRFPVSAKLCDDLDLANKSTIEGWQILGRDPIFEMRPATSLLDLVAIQEAPCDTKAGDVALAARRYVPIARDPDGVGFAENRVEDRLLRKPRRKGTHP